MILILRRRRYRPPRLSRSPARSIVDRLLRGQQARAYFVWKATKDSDRSSIDIIRMSKHVFERLCADLVAEGGLKKLQNVEVDEMVVMFLWTVGHTVKNRILQKKFARSGKTICAVIHAVLQSILNMHETLYVKANPNTERHKHAPWKHFKVHAESYYFYFHNTSLVHS
ncbi:hypothetical protein LINGRAPRIM_LOCUS2603 [Linum grandiflorum]